MKSLTGRAVLPVLFVGIGFVVVACKDGQAPTTSPTPPPAEPAPQPPAVPVGLRVAAADYGVLVWSWLAVDGASGYDVQFSTEEPFTDEEEIIERSAEETAYRREGLVGGTTAYLRVRSAADAGDDRRTSTWSEPVSGHPEADPSLVSLVMIVEYIRTDVSGDWHSGYADSARIVLGESLSLLVRARPTNRLQHDIVWNSSDPCGGYCFHWPV